MLMDLFNPLKNSQLTFAMIKSDAIRNRVADKIINKLNELGFSIYYKNTPTIVHLTEEQILAFYADHVDREYFPDLKASVYDRVIPLILIYKPESDDVPQEAFSKLRSIIGSTNARTAQEGTIRAEFGGHNFNPEAPMAENAIHASDSLESARREIEIIFPHLILADDTVSEDTSIKPTKGEKPYVENITMNNDSKENNILSSYFEKITSDIPASFSEEHIAFLRQMFFAGAGFLFSTVMTVMSGEGEPTPEQIRIMGCITVELAEYAKTLEKELLHDTPR